MSDIQITCEAVEGGHTYRVVCAHGHTASIHAYGPQEAPGPSRNAIQWLAEVLSHKCGICPAEIKARYPL